MKFKNLLITRIYRRYFSSSSSSSKLYTTEERDPKRCQSSTSDSLSEQQHYRNYSPPPSSSSSYPLYDYHETIPPHTHNKPHSVRIKVHFFEGLYHHMDLKTREALIRDFTDQVVYSAHYDSAIARDGTIYTILFQPLQKVSWWKSKKKYPQILTLKDEHDKIIGTVTIFGWKQIFDYDVSFGTDSDNCKFS